METLERMSGAGYTVEVVWECQFEQDHLPRHPELNNHPILQHAPLNTGVVLYGCRTEDMLLHYATREGETIQFFDVMSLYPYICIYSKFPVGHTTIHVGDACRDKQAMLSKEDLIKCTVLPPKTLYYPVMPYRCNKKLLFCLRKTCAVEWNFSGECIHESKAQRSLTSTWVLDEVQLAIQKGYQVLDIMEAYEYEVTKYDPQTREGRLFADYINTFFKLKAEPSGYPAWVRNPEDEERYVATFNAREGVLMDRVAIRPNAAKRALAKLCFNSLCGKLAERRNRTQTKLISDPLSTV